MSVTSYSVVKYYAIPVYTTVFRKLNTRIETCKVGKVHPCTGTETL